MFTTKPEVPRDVASSRSPYDVRKHFISEHILRMICRYTNEEAQRRSNEQFTVSIAELETFVRIRSLILKLTLTQYHMKNLF